MPKQPRLSCLTVPVGFSGFGFGFCKTHALSSPDHPPMTFANSRTPLLAAFLFGVFLSGRVSLASHEVEVSGSDRYSFFVLDDLEKLLGCC